MVIIDDFFKRDDKTPIDKNTFYLGRITQVSREKCVFQVENLSLLSTRKYFAEAFVPNTINYLVLIDSPRSIFIGEVLKNELVNSKSIHAYINHDKNEALIPAVTIDVVGVMENEEDYFKLPEFKTVGVSDKVYLAPKRAIKRYIESMEPKRIAGEGGLSSFANYLDRPDVGVELKASTLFDNHLFVVGATNSGKSTSALAILDKLLGADKKVLIIDPTGEYDEAFKDKHVSKKTLGADVTISPAAISSYQWELLFQLNSNTQGSVLYNAIRSLRYQKKENEKKKGEKKEEEEKVLKKVGKNVTTIENKLESVKDYKDFDLRLLADQIYEENVELTRDGSEYQLSIFKVNSNRYLEEKVRYQLENSQLLKFFGCGEADDNGEEKKDFFDVVDTFLDEEKSSLYINASGIRATDGVGGMIIDLLCRYIINRKEEHKPFVMFVDEVHRYTKNLTHDGEGYFDGLTVVSREGRKKGFFLFLTTQNPKDVSSVLLGQVGTVLVHRLAHPDEIEAIKNHLDGNSSSLIKRLNQGEAILSSVNLLKDLYLSVNKCDRIHKNETRSI